MDIVEKTNLVLDAIDEAIKEAGNEGIPSGHLYTILMGKMSLDLYQRLIDYLVAAKRITNKGHLLKTAN